MSSNNYSILSTASALVAGCVVTAIHANTAQAAQPFLLPNSLIISSTTYDNSQGAIASLAVGSRIGTTAAAPVAVAGNDYVNVWNNDTADGNFGVTTPIVLTAVEPQSGHVFGSLQVPTDQVVTSFSSKSEGSLSFTRDANGPHVTLIGYAGSGVGALDVSNSDAVAGQDISNPVTVSFGASYAFHRTIVSVDARGQLSYTPTDNYGGDNGRAALLGSNGLYYTVGNSNNGAASTFNNPTMPNVTETTGLVVVNPINAASVGAAVPDSNPAEVDPLLQLCNNPNPFLEPCNKLDKAGKDDNYRGVTEFGGALYFTKGSGSNGIDTVYTVSTLPTPANAASTAISVVPGFPTDSARATNGNFTPFAVFFANATTMYVTDEGTGSSTDATTHAGLQKWSLVNAVWQLDYVLSAGLIGTVDTGLNGSDGQYPDVTTVGLRDLTGVVEGNKVTLWATTATSSASGDPGADPNKVVQIIDDLGATTMTVVANEAFTVVAGPTYGTVYRGVAYVTP
jgi:hypothetical protein